MALSDNELIKKVPFSLEAEQSVLGSILIDPEKFSEISNIVKSEDFYLPSHSRIFEAMNKLFIQSRSIDVVTLIDSLVRDGVYETNEEGIKYIKVIAEVVPSAANVKDYARIVHDKSYLRRLIEICNNVSEQAYAETDSADNLLDSAERQIFSLAETHENKTFVHISNALVTAFDRLKQLQIDKSSAIGQPTGFSELDKVLVGMGPGNLILIGARPGMGKTSFAMNIATQVAIKSKKTVCIFSLEMTTDELVSRMLSSEALVDSYAIRSGNLTSDDWEKLARSSSVLGGCEILIDDTSAIKPSAMLSKLRRVRNLGLVVVDYLQLMQSDVKSDNRVHEVGDISRNLKLIAKELNVPVICCAQLSRGPESRTDKRPMLSDLRDSGAIEQDADVVMFLYRDEYYDTADKKEGVQNIAEVIISKNRHGNTGNIKMGWFGQYLKFTTLSDRSE